MLITSCPCILYAVRASRGYVFGSFLWSSFCSFRHGSHRRSGVGVVRSRTNPQHSKGYSRMAWALICANSAGVTIIGGTGLSVGRGPARTSGRGRACISERGRASPPGRGPASPPGEGRNDRDLVPVLQDGAEPVQRFDRLAVHVHVDVIVNLPRLVAHEAFERPEPILELVEQPAHVLRVHGHLVLVVGRPAKGRGYVHLDAHHRSPCRSERDAFR